MSTPLGDYIDFAAEKSDGDPEVKLAILIALLELYRPRGLLLEAFSQFQADRHKAAGVLK